MSLEVYKKGGWPMTSHSGIIVLQHFFIEDTTIYPVILGQPFMIVVHMDTKVLDDGSAYASDSDNST